MCGFVILRGICFVEVLWIFVEGRVKFVCVYFLGFVCSFGSGVVGDLWLRFVFDVLFRWERGYFVGS